MTKRYEIVAVTADDHFFAEGSTEEVAKDQCHVWGVGVVTRKTSRGLYLASAGAKFDKEEINDGTPQTTTHYFRRPYRARRVGEAEF